MNIVLFEPGELDAPLASNDRRVDHVRRILKKKEGEAFRAGEIGGRLGTAWIERFDGAGARFGHEFSEPSPSPYPVELVVGFTRPHEASRILSQAAALGVATIRLVSTELGEKSYASSHLWSGGNARGQMVAGAEQAGTTILPALRLFARWDDLCVDLPSEAVRIALDNEKASGPLFGRRLEPGCRVVLAVGSERGWTDRERERLTENGFRLLQIGQRALRTETAVVAGLAIVIGGMGYL